MEREQPNRPEPVNPWVRALVLLVTLGVGGYGIICLVRARMVTEGVVLEGFLARIVGAIIAGLAAISLIRSLHARRGGKR